MATEKIIIDDDFKLIGGSDTPPKKKEIDELEKTKIPQSEKDVDGLELLLED